MNVALTAFTGRGAALARRIAEGLSREGFACFPAFGKKLAGAAGYENLRAWAGEQFARADALVFVGACGIAVRTIAPFVKDKFTDPAVVCVDEAGRFAVSLLSGHVGGANRLARLIADVTGGEAVVSTATDVNGLFAVDEWAAARGFAMDDRALAKEVSAALLRGETPGFASDFPMECPPGLRAGAASLGVRVTARTDAGPFSRTLRLIPRCLTLGVGCRRGTEETAIRAAVERALSGWDLRAVRAVCSIDLKKDEPGLLAFCRSLGLPLSVYSAERLRAVPGEFAFSEFVYQTTGVGNVCERAAALGGRLVVRRYAGEGVTVAAAIDESACANG